MTIALGIIADDGLVLAADRQETVPGYWKYESGKVAGLSLRNERHYLFTGAGTANYLDSIYEKLSDGLIGSEAMNPRRVAASCSSILKGFYQEHVIPFAALPYGERPDVQLLIAYSSGALSGHLFVSENTVVRECGDYGAVGVGSMLAKTILGRCYRHESAARSAPKIREAVVLAAYVMFQVKASIDGCGKSTDIYGFRNGRRFVIPRRGIERLEQSLSRYSAAFEEDALYCLRTNKGPKTSRTLDSALKAARRVVAALKI